MDTTTSNTNDARRDIDGTVVRETPPTREGTTQRDATARPRSPKAHGLASQSRSRTRVAPRIYKTRRGLPTTVNVNGVHRELRFPPGTPLKTIRPRRHELRASLRTLPSEAPHTLTPDADRHLDQMTGNLTRSVEQPPDIEPWLRPSTTLHTTPENRCAP